MTRITDSTLGDLIAVVYEEFMAIYGDEELASVATAPLVNDMLSRAAEDELEAVYEPAA